MVRPRVFNEEFPGVVFYVDDLSSDKQHWNRVFLADNSDPKSPRAIIARYGSWVGDSSKERLQLHLDQGASYCGQNRGAKQGRHDPVFLPGDPHQIEEKRRYRTEDRADAQEGCGAKNRIFMAQFPQVSAKSENHSARGTAQADGAAFCGFPVCDARPCTGGGPCKRKPNLRVCAQPFNRIVFYVLFFNGLRLAQVGKISPFWGAWSANILLSAMGLILFSKVEHGFRFMQHVSRFLWHFSMDTLIPKVAARQDRTVTLRRWIVLNRPADMPVSGFPKSLTSISPGDFSFISSGP